MGWIFLGLGLLVAAGMVASVFASRHYRTKADTAMIKIKRRPSKRRVRDTVVQHAVLLASEMARVDGYIAPEEMDAIRDFIVDHVKRADQDFAARMMRKGLENPASHTAVDASIAAIAEVADPEQRKLVVDLLAFVARADGVIVPEEEAFVLRIGGAIGLDEDEIRATLGPVDERG